MDFRLNIKVEVYVFYFLIYLFDNNRYFILDMFFRISILVWFFFISSNIFFVVKNIYILSFYFKVDLVVLVVFRMDW